MLKKCLSFCTHATNTVYAERVASPDGYGSFAFEVRYLTTKRTIVPVRKKDREAIIRYCKYCTLLAKLPYPSGEAASFVYIDLVV